MSENQRLKNGDPDAAGWPGRGTALVTGASEGIGHELTKLFARNGYNVVLVARNEEKLNRISGDLERIYGISAKVIAKDLSVSAAPGEIYDELRREGVQVDVLVNNAGYIVYGPFAETDMARELDMLQVLVYAPVVLTKLFLPDMLRRNSGKILNLGSIGSFTPGPNDSLYCAAKAFVLSFSHAIAEELAGSGVTVTALCPGSTRTEFARRGNIENIFLANVLQMSAEKVAETGYEALMKNKRHVVPGFLNKLVVNSGRFVPWALQARVSRLLMS